MIFWRSKLFACLAPWRDEKEVRKKLCLAQSRQDRQGRRRILGSIRQMFLFSMDAGQQRLQVAEN